MMALPAAFLVANEPWQQRGVCRVENVPVAAFFPGSGEPLTEQRAMCARCPVKTECLAYALRTNTKHGMWGGTSERERRILRIKVSEQGILRIKVSEQGTTYSRASAHGAAIRRILADGQWHTLDELVEAATPHISSAAALATVQSHQRRNHATVSAESSPITDARGRRTIVKGLLHNMRKHSLENSAGRFRHAPTRLKEHT